MGKSADHSKASLIIHRKSKSPKGYASLMSLLMQQIGQTALAGVDGDGCEVVEQRSKTAVGRGGAARLTSAVGSATDTSCPRPSETHDTVLQTPAVSMESQPPLDR